MKKWRRYFQKLFITHIAAFEEQLNDGGIHRPAPHAAVIRSSVTRFFKYGEPELAYLLIYDPLYDEAIDELRKDGWMICLEAGGVGGLHYGIYADAGKAASPFGL